MRVIWDSKAKENRTRIANYVRQQFGAKRKIRFLQEVREMTQQLRRSPYIGQIDPLFEGRSKTYRSVIVNGLNKMVYYVEDDTVHIAAFWDTRREPTSSIAIRVAHTHPPDLSAAEAPQGVPAASVCLSLI